jgi:hypothetical protein
MAEAKSPVAAARELAPLAAELSPLLGLELDDSQL